MRQVDNKYEINQEVFFLSGKDITRAKVESFGARFSEHYTDHIEYRIKHGNEISYRYEQELFANVEELLDYLRNRFKKYGH